MKILLLIASLSFGMDQKIGIVTSGNIGDGAVTTAKLADGSVTTSKFHAGALEPIYLDKPNGRAGVGTASPSAKLEVESAAQNTAEIKIEGTVNDADNQILSFYGRNTTPAAVNYGSIRMLNSDRTPGSEIGAMRFYTMSAGVSDERMRILGGNVGIGTTNPSNKLHVVGSGATLENGSSDFTFDIGGSGSSLARMAYDNTNNIFNISVFEGGSEGAKMTFESGSGGGIGIGTTNPGNPLEVAGADPVKLSTWTATYTGGSAHVCVNDSGVLFVSEAACP